MQFLPNFCVLDIPLLDDFSALSFSTHKFSTPSGPLDDIE